MQIVFIFTLLASLALASSAQVGSAAEAPGEIVVRLLLVAAAMGGSMVAATWITAAVRRGAQRPEAELAAWLDFHDRLQQLHGVLWVCLSASIILVLRWPELVRFHWGMDGWPLLDELLIVAPVALPLLASWAIFPAADGSRLSWRRSWAYICWRASGSCLVLLPVALFLVWIDIVTLLAPGVLQTGYAWIVYAAPVLIAPATLPFVLRKMWRLEPVGAGLQKLFAETAVEAGISANGFYVWDTPGAMNAAVCGISRWRCVMFTRELLDFLPPPELQAVFHHEAAHIRRGHLPLRLLVIAQPVFFWLALQQAAPQSIAAASEALAQAGLSVQLQTGLLSPLLIAGWLGFSLGTVARWLEFDADLSTPRGYHQPLARALGQMADHAGYDRQRRSWLHPSINDRIKLLERSVGDASLAGGFSRRTGMVRWLLIVASVVSLAIAVAA